jgi:hypothetical protein
MVDIKSGKLEIAKATQITKMAEQVISSVYVEMKAQYIQSTLNSDAKTIGGMSLISKKDD